MKQQANMYSLVGHTSDNLFENSSGLRRVDQNVPRVSPGGEKIIFAMGDEAGDATWDDVDHLTEFRLYLPTYNNDHELTFY